MMLKIIRNADFVLTVDGENRVLTQNSIAVRANKIEDIGPVSIIDEKYAAESKTVIDASGFLVMPGMIDAHMHISEGLTRGLFPDNLSTRPWVFNWAKPAYAAMGVEDEYVSTILSAIEMIRTGTTCFLDMGSQNQDIGHVIDAIGQVGIRGVTGRHCADRIPKTIPAHWTREFMEKHFFADAATALDCLGDCVKKYNHSANDRVRVWVNIEGKEPCSLELHVGSRALAEQLGVGTTYHIASSIEESRVSEEKYGMWPVTRLYRNGALGHNLVLAHVAAVTEQEVAYLAETGTHVAFCPGTSMKIAKGATKIGLYPEMIAAGVNICLGCDGTAASGNLDMMRSVYLAAGLFKDCRMDAGLVPANDALRMATINGAQALQWADEIGSIEIGKKADLVFHDLNECSWVPCFDPVQVFVYAARPSAVSKVMIDGEMILDEGRILTVDEAEVNAQARELAVQVVKRAGLQVGVTPVLTTAYDN